MSVDDRNSVSRRQFLKGAALIGMGVVVTACAPPTGAPAPSGEAAEGAVTPSTQPVEIEFWDMVWGPPEYIEAGEAICAQYSEENPNIQVVYQSTPWNNWYQTFATAIGSGTAPDMSTGASFQSVHFFAQDAIASANDVVDEWKANGVYDDFVGNSVEVLNYEGNYVAVPWGIDIRIPYYRSDLYDAVGATSPTSWAEWRAAVEATTHDGQYGIVGMNDTGGIHYIFLTMMNNAGGLFTEDRQSNMMEDRNIEAVTFLSDMVKDGLMHPASAGYAGADANKAFGQGDAAFIIRGPNYRAVLPDIADQIGTVSPMTSPNGDKGTISWVNNISMYSDSDVLPETKQFLLWWSDNQLPLWTSGHSTQLPTRASFAKDPYFAEDAETTFILNEWVPVGLPMSRKSPGIFPAVNEVEGGGVLFTLIQDILQGKDVMESMEAADAGMKEILGQA